MADSSQMLAMMDDARLWMWRPRQVPSKQNKKWNGKERVAPSSAIESETNPGDCCQRPPTRPIWREFRNGEKHCFCFVFNAHILAGHSPPLFTWTAADGVLSTNMATRRHFVTNQMHILRRFISAAALPRREINSSKNKKRKEKKKKRQNEMK